MYWIWRRGRKERLDTNGGSGIVKFLGCCKIETKNIQSFETAVSKIIQITSLARTNIKKYKEQKNKRIVK